MSEKMPDPTNLVEDTKSLGEQLGENLATNYGAAKTKTEIQEIRKKIDTAISEATPDREAEVRNKLYLAAEKAITTAQEALKKQAETAIQEDTANIQERLALLSAEKFSISFILNTAI